MKKAENDTMQIMSDAQNMAAIITAIGALLTALSALALRWFDARKSSTENKSIEVSITEKVLRYADNAIDEYVQENDRLRTIANKQQAQIDMLMQQVHTLQTQMTFLRVERTEWVNVVVLLLQGVRILQNDIVNLSGEIKWQISQDLQDRIDVLLNTGINKEQDDE